MKHKYLHELFPDGDLPFPYGEDDFHDFDEREALDMDYSLILWLYEMFRYFQDEVSKILDRTERKFDIDGEILNHPQCLNRMIENCKIIIKSDDFDEKEQREAAKDDLFKVLSKVIWTMWM